MDILESKVIEKKIFLAGIGFLSCGRKPLEDGLGQNYQEKRKEDIK